MTITLDALTLSNDLMWNSQYNWSPVVQTVSYAIDGTMIVEAGTKMKGRPVSLTGGSNFGWMQRSLIDQIYAKAVVAGLTMTLVYKGTSLTVMFDHERGALDLALALPYSEYASNDWIQVNSINFITV